MGFWKSLFIRPGFFYAFGGFVFLLAISHAFPLLFFPARLLVGVFAVASIVDITLLYASVIHISSKRKLAQVFSLGDVNTVELSLQNTGNQSLQITVIEELPAQFQIRDFHKALRLAPFEFKTLKYDLEPKVRGLYSFYSTLIFVRSKLGFFERKIITGLEQKVAVYPSIQQSKKYQLLSNATTSISGLKKTRRLGHNYEFDHIKSYVIGDDYRSINWKMTGKRNSLMVNQYEEEKSQQVYCILDEGRAMGMPFNRLSLMDYAVNSSLALASIAVQTQDRAGLIMFSKKINTYLKADSNYTQLQKVFQHLYNAKQNDQEPNYELLYTFVRRNINTRSVLVLFTNFESKFSLQRALPVLRMINKRHLLITVFFENDQLKQFSSQPVDSLESIYTKGIAEKMVNEKKQHASLLRQHGIHTVLTSPEKLTVNTLNKYLELKSRGMA